MSGKLIILISLIVCTAILKVNANKIIKEDTEDFFLEDNTTPSPNEADFIGVDKKMNTTCILMSFNATINILLKTEDKTGNVSVILDKKINPTVEAHCDNSDEQSITFEWFPEVSSEQAWVLKFFFTKKDNEHYQMSQFAIWYNFDNGTIPKSLSVPETINVQSNVSLFNVANSKTYRCSSDSLSSENKDININFQLLKIEAFIKTGGKDFTGDEQKCDKDAEKPSNLVPIIVGICLALLIVVVMIAYVIGRRRQQTGYEQIS